MHIKIVLFLFKLKCHSTISSNHHPPPSPFLSLSRLVFLLFPSQIHHLFSVFPKEKGRNRPQATLFLLHITQRSKNSTHNLSYFRERRFFLCIFFTILSFLGNPLCIHTTLTSHFLTTNCLFPLC